MLTLIDSSKRESDFFATPTDEIFIASDVVSLTISVKAESTLKFSMSRAKMSREDASTSFVPFNGIINNEF